VPALQDEHDAHHGGRAYDERKFAEFVLYVAQKSATDPRCGAVKLNKLLFYADFWSYASRGVSITGAEYQRLPLGPAPRRLVPVRDRLVQEGAAALQQFQVLQHVGTRLVALRDPDFSCLDAADIAIADAVVEENWELDGTDLSARTHELEGWKLAKDQETIPYFTVNLVKQPKEWPADVIEYGKKVADRLRGEGYA
jgi:Antitoxin SocA-like, Panacea domain